MPPVHHHNGFIVTGAFGHTNVRLNVARNKESKECSSYHQGNVYFKKIRAQKTHRVLNFQRITMSIMQEYFCNITCPSSHHHICIICIVLITKVFLEVAIKCWPELDSNPLPIYIYKSRVKLVVSFFLEKSNITW